MLDKLVTGQEFSRPFLGLPATWFVEKVLLALAAQINPSMRVRVKEGRCMSHF